MLLRILPFLSILFLSSEQVNAYAKVSSGSEWLQLETLEPLGDTAGGGDGFGFSVATSVSGEIVAIGSPFEDEYGGKVAVHKYDDKNGWVQMGEDIFGLGPDSFFGYDVALSDTGTILAVSSTLETSSEMTGFVSVFKFSSRKNSWEEIGENIKGATIGKDFGTSIAFNEKGTIIAIGEPVQDHTKPGSVSVYQYDSSNQGDTWKKMGNTINGKSNGDQFGFTVDITEHKGDIYVGIGAPLDENEAGSAMVYRFNRGENKWDKHGTRYVDGDVSGTKLGQSVSLGHDGEKLIFAVGFPGPGIDLNSPIKSGVEVYSITFDGQWDYYSEMILPLEEGDETGKQVSLSRDGQTLAVTSPFYNEGSGMVRVFKYNKKLENASGELDDKNGPYELVAEAIIGGKNDEFGDSLSLSRDGTKVCVGSFENSYVATFLVPMAAAPGRSKMSALFALLIAVVIVGGLYVMYKVVRRKFRGIQFSSVDQQNNNHNDDHIVTDNVEIPVRRFGEKPQTDETVSFPIRQISDRVDEPEII